MRALGAMWMGKAGAMDATQAASACGYVLGAELRACGVDLSFTPVLDLTTRTGRALPAVPSLATAPSMPMHGW